MKLPFCDLIENRVVIERWCQFYNRSGPHSALDYRDSNGSTPPKSTSASPPDSYKIGSRLQH
jgi:hypothetical protein